MLVVASLAVAHTLQLQGPSVVVYRSWELGYVGGVELLSPLTAYHSVASFLFPGQHLHSDRAQCDAFLLMYVPLSWHQGPIQPSGQAAGSKSKQRSAWQHVGTHVQHHAAPCVAPCGADTPAGRQACRRVSCPCPTHLDAWLCG